MCLDGAQELEAGAKACAMMEGISAPEGGLMVS